MIGERRHARVVDEIAARSGRSPAIMRTSDDLDAPRVMDASKTITIASTAAAVSRRSNGDRLTPFSGRDA
jgi:hypothetical protein